MQSDEVCDPARRKMFIAFERVVVSEILCIILHLRDQQFPL